MKACTVKFMTMKILDGAIIVLAKFFECAEREERFPSLEIKSFSKLGVILTKKTALTAVPRHHNHGSVVVPMQENQRFLPQHDENRVHKLENLRHDEQEVP